MIDPLITDEAVKEYMYALVKSGQKVHYVQVGGPSHAFFDWKPNERTKATMEAFFNSVLNSSK